MAGIGAVGAKQFGGALDGGERGAGGEHRLAQFYGFTVDDDALRAHFADADEDAPAGENPRAILLGMLRSLRGMSVEAIEALCTGERFAPAPLSGDERACLAMVELNGKLLGVELLKECLWAIP